METKPTVVLLACLVVMKDIQCQVSGPNGVGLYTGGRAGIPNSFATAPLGVPPDAGHPPPTPATTALPSPLTQRVGSFGVLVGICMFAAPFATIREVISKQSADSLPLPIISVNLINAGQ